MSAVDQGFREYYAAMAGADLLKLVSNGKSSSVAPAGSHLQAETRLPTGRWALPHVSAAAAGRRLRQRMTGARTSRYPGIRGSSVAIQRTKAGPLPFTRILLAGGWGAALGFQCCWLAEFGLNLPVPWFGLAYIFASHVLLGMTLGAMVGRGRWWRQGFGLGLAFGIPTAAGAATLGLALAPFGIAAVTEGLAAGGLMAFLAHLIHGHSEPAPTPRKPFAVQNWDTREEAFRTDWTYQRLAEEKACLDHLAAEREYRRDAGYGKTTEHRVIWTELLELELQMIDEQVNRISAGGAKTPSGIRRNSRSK